jgi:hypothetical protein
MCTQGAITVTTPSGATVRVEAGQKTDVSSGTPSAPSTITKADEEAMDVDVKENTVTKEEKKEKAKELVSSILAPSEDVSEDINDDNKSGETKEIESVVYSGRNISSDGSQESISIESQNGDLTTSNLKTKGMIAEDNGISTQNGDVISWGHWQDNPNKKWVVGKATDVKVLDEMRNTTGRTVKASYSGQTMGSVNGSDNILVDGNNKVQFNLTTGDNIDSTIDGSIQFKTASGQTWNTNDATGNKTINANVVQGTNSFETHNVGGSVLDKTGAKAIDSGAVAGQFYGDNANAIGGTFELNAGENKATGVFKATK